jgi:two-component system, NtrC family, sensor histidine kinase GlrK
VANVVRNAVAVSARGQRVKVRAEVDPTATHDQPRGRVRITIRDQGPGVPDEIRETLFDAFVTRSVPNSSKALGIGIGLALAREVARAHGGDLALRPQVERGSTFELWLPLPAEPDDAEASG